MALEPGTRLGPYSIESPLGQGGMGEVYRARDTRLDRTVAIKVLPPQMASSAELRQRFEREARAVSSLNHPNICTLYDVGHEGETHFLVMELIEGESLAARLQRGALPIEEMLEYAIQIADALDRAHRQGVVHRDLKPGNVMLTGSGAKLLDFGLAKTAAEAAPISSVAMTQASPLTAQGTIVGTFQYMSPEQMEGKEADARSDIFAFGAVLYEMATGRPAFTGESQASLIASIMGKEPPSVTAQQPSSPAGLERAVKKCLAKEPDERWQTVSDLKSELQWIAEGKSQPVAQPAPSSGRRSTLLAWALVVLLGAVAAVLGLTSLGRESAPRARITASILPPPGAGFDVSSRGLILSPDGSELAFIARDQEGVRRLWIRPLDRNEARSLEGTEGARSPFWSPDGRFIAFFADGKLKKLEIATGLLESLTDSEPYLGGAWSAQGHILFSSWSDGIRRIPEGGGAPESVVKQETAGDANMAPHFLPDGRHFLYLVRTYGREERMGQIRLGSLDGSVSKVLFPSNSNALYTGSGHVIWWQDGNLRAQAFDATRLELVGESFPLIPDVRFDPRNGFMAASVSETGLLVYQEGGSVSGDELVWIDRQGNELGTVGSPGSLYGPRLSPDGSRIALDISGETNQGDIWLLDVARDSGTRFTLFPEDDTRPVWSPQGDAVLFESMAGGAKEAVYIRDARGRTEPKLVVKDPEAGLSASDWSPEDLVMLVRYDDTTQDIWIYSIKDEKLLPYLTTPFFEHSGEIAPGGRYLVYVSDETGREEVYVQTFPEPGERWRVSHDGGRMPAWRPDGEELFYTTLDGRMMALSVSGLDSDDTSAFRFGNPEMLFRSDIKEHNARQYDTLDGQRFLVNRSTWAGATVPLTLIVNWQSALGR